MQLISNFVMELLEVLDVDYRGNEINEEGEKSKLQANVVLVDTLERPEDLMVYLCSIG